MRKRPSLVNYLDVIRPPAIAVMLDDGGPTQYSEGYVYMNAAGLKGTLYAITDKVDDGSHVTTANLTTMYAAGWDIANHTTDHTDLTTLSQANIETRLTGARDWLNTNGFTRASRHVGYPFGSSNATVIDAMQAVNMLTGRGINEAMDVLPLSITKRYAIDSYALDSGKTLVQAKALIDTAISSNKLMCVYIHNINASPGANDWSTSNFEGFVDYIVSTGIRAITISELYNAYAS